MRRELPGARHAKRPAHLFTQSSPSTGHGQFSNLKHIDRLHNGGQRVSKTSKDVQPIFDNLRRIALPWNNAETALARKTPARRSMFDNSGGMLGCGGSSNSSNAGSTPTPIPGTTSGNYQVVVTGTSGALVELPNNWILTR
jgi:hypothetical protein